MTASQFEQGYIIGLIVGGGSFTGDRPACWLQVKLHARDPEPLNLLKFHLGGRIHGPYHHGGRHYLFYRLDGPALRAALPFFYENLPTSHKREQFITWAGKWGLDYWECGT